MADSFQSSKVTSAETSSATKFNAFVQGVEDAVNSIDNSNIAVGAAIAVAKLAAGSNDDVLTTVAGVPTWQAPAASSGVPSGVVAPFAGSVAPVGWFVCDGQAVSRATYAALYSAIGTTYGAGDGVNTFNVPDLQGRVAVGKGTHSTVNALAGTDGTALANRSPAHRHTARYRSTGSDGNDAIGSSWHMTPQEGTITNAVGPGAGTEPLDTPAYLVLNYIIKA